MVRILNLRKPCRVHRRVCVTRNHSNLIYIFLAWASQPSQGRMDVVISLIVSPNNSNLFTPLLKQLNFSTCRLCSYISNLSLRKMFCSIDVRSSFQMLPRSSFKSILDNSIFIFLCKQISFDRGQFYGRSNSTQINIRSSIPMSTMRSNVNDPLMINWD